MQTANSNTQVVTQDAAPVAPALNLVPAPTAAEVAALEAKAFEQAQAKKAQAIAKFETVVPFKLEQETVGARALARSVSKAGAVKVTIASKKDCAALSGGLKGGDLDAWRRMRMDELKADQSKAAAALSGDNNWSGKELQLSAKGDVITMKWVKVLPQTISLAAPTDEVMAKQLDMSVDEYRAFKAQRVEAKKAAAQAEKDAKELAALEADEQARLATEQAAE
jgi:hypothetical protein